MSDDDAPVRHRLHDAARLLAAHRAGQLFGLRVSLPPNFSPANLRDPTDAHASRRADASHSDPQIVLRAPRLPARLLVTGSGPAALEYASTFAHVGVAVTLAHAGPRLPADCDDWVVTTLLAAFRRLGVRIASDTRLISAEPSAHSVTARLSSGATITADALLRADDDAEPTPPAGAPRLLRTIPAVATVGPSENSLRAAGQPFAVGRAALADHALGQLTGDTAGELRLLASRPDGSLLAVQCVAACAAEMITPARAALASNLRVAHLASLSADPASPLAVLRAAACDALSRL